LVPVIAAAVLAACGESKTTTEELAGDAGEQPPPETLPQTEGNQPAGGNGKTGLPCDVQGVIENRCWACHDKTDPPSLLTYEDLVAPSKRDPNKKRVEVAIELMKAGAMPPKPAVPAEADEIEPFEEWLKAGLKENGANCTDPPAGAGTGAGGDGGTGNTNPDGGVVMSDAGPTSPGVVCTSGKMWTDGNTGSPLMHPGQACLTCHSKAGGPALRIAGTVFPTLHEPDDCIGAQPPITVTVTDSRNRVFTMAVNASGNFIQRSAGGIFGQNPRPPLRVQLSANGKTKTMTRSVTTGDCNSCHTVEGKNGAPGRISVP
jgi:hypothetical protein